MNPDAKPLPQGTTTHAHCIEMLSQKLARHLAPHDWRQLFHGAGAGAIGFEQKVQTVLYADLPDERVLTQTERDAFSAEVEWLALRYGASVDQYVDGAAAVFFDEPGPCVRMAMDLQRSAHDLRLRMGVHRGVCIIATFSTGGEARCTLVGGEAGMAAQMALTAASGSIAVSPATYPKVMDDVQADCAGCLVMEEFHDSDLAQVCLTPAPAQGGPDLSTFAGLGRL